MGRTNKGVYNKYSQDMLRDAIQAVQAGMSVRKAAKEFKVPKSTLYDHQKGKSQLGVKAGRKRCIPEEIENQVVDKVIAAAQSGFPLTKQQFLIKVGLLAKKLNLETMFKNNIPGDDYWRGVKTRRPDLVVRTPEGCNTNRMRGMNRRIVLRYFDDLQKLLSDNGLESKPHCIWNADETSMQFSPAPSKVLAKKGSRELLARTNNATDTVTMMVTINAQGDAMPPLCITKGKTRRSIESYATLDAPAGTVWTFQENAWMNNVLGTEWFKEVFLKNCEPERPQLLILDSHGSHEVVELLEQARQENILILALPPHATHMLQPLDRVVFAPFKRAYRRQCTEFMSEHPGHVINKLTWPRILNSTWQAVMEPELLRKSFKATGIFPCNHNEIPETAFAPSDALDRVDPQVDDVEVGAEGEHGIGGGEVEEGIDAEGEHGIGGGDVEEGIDAEGEHGTGGGEVEEEMETEQQQQEQQQQEDVGYCDDIIPINITMEDVAGLDNLLVDVEGVTMRLDLSTDADLPISADWNTEVNALFDIPTASTPTRRPNSRSITSHRLLTSEEIYNSKVAQKEEKERKEKAKELRKQKRLEKNQNSST